jgi:hypothetical protein
MITFHFSLERVLHYRALQRASEEAKLQRLVEEEALLESKLQIIDNVISEMPARIAALDELRGRDLNLMAAYRIRLTKERDSISGMCRQKKCAIAEQVEVHRKAKQRHRLLEELRTRQHHEWVMQASRELDELAHESYLARWTAP